VRIEDVDMTMNQGLPKLDDTLCTLCGLCVDACACQAVTLGDHGPVFACSDACPYPDPSTQSCDCHCLCEEVCPTGAITWEFDIVLGPDRNPDSPAAEQTGSTAGTGAAATPAKRAGAGGGSRQ
jgi:formate hydrogenlyase subunit 6/NADH:ubiquinone oxidoreductase subunit I